MKKKLMALLLAGAMTASLSACKNDKEGDSDTTNGGGTKSPSASGDSTTKTNNTTTGGDGKTVINVYTFTDETESMIKDNFLKDNPDFSNKYELVYKKAADAGAHKLNVQTSIGQPDGPDLFVADVDYSVMFAKLEGTASLEDLGISINPSDYYSYTLSLGQVDGKQIGISHQATPGAMYYRADIAEKVLGTKSEDDMQNLVSDWDKFVGVAQKLKNSDEGSKFKMIEGADELKRTFLNAREEAWIDADDVLTIDNTTLEKFVETTQAIKDLGMLGVSGTAQWDDAWKKGMLDGVFCYFGSTWFLHYSLKPETLAEKPGDGVDTDAAFWEKQREDNNGSFGKWGIVSGPNTYYWGGTYWFGSKDAAADADKKDAIKQIIEYFCVNDSSMEAFAKSTGDFVSKKTVVDKIKNDEVFENPFFLYRTNHYIEFAKIADKIDITKTITEYDAAMNDAMNEFINAIFANNKTYDEAIDILKNKVKADIPGITVV